MSNRWFFKTKEERKAAAAEKVERKRLARLDKEIRRECKYYEKLIPEVVANCGVNHWLPMAQRPTVLESAVFDRHSDQRIRIIHSRFNEHAIYQWIDVRYLPWNHNIAHLKDEDVLETLSYACGRQVVFRGNPGSGCWYVIWRDGAINAIPNLFAFADAAMMIKPSAPPLYFIVGISENNRLIHGDLAKMPHYLVAGATFAGKSVHLNSMLCQIIQRNNAGQVRFVMIDLKGGSELGFYKGIPHLMRDIVTEPEDVTSALIDLEKIVKERIDMFTAGHVKNVEGWNHVHPDEKLPYIVLVFDELAQVLKHPDRKMARDAETRLGSLMAISRAAGVHVVLCTQSPKSDVITTWVKINAPVRICFAVPSNQDSMTVIDKALAAGLEPVGRAIYSAGPAFHEIQSPFISDSRIDSIVKEAISGQAQTDLESPHKPGLQDLLIEAVDNFGGDLHIRKLYQALQGALSYPELEAILNSIPPRVEVHGETYRFVYKGNGRHGGRRLEKIQPVAEPDLRTKRFDLNKPLPTNSSRVTPGLLKSASQMRKNGHDQ